jgi:hypothetical protein
MNTKTTTALISSDLQYNWYFYWGPVSAPCEMSLKNKTQDEAFKIASELGWEPAVWYRPSTWDNTGKRTA